MGFLRLDVWRGIIALRVNQDESGGESG